MDNSHKIRRARLSDLEGIIRLERTSFEADSFSRRQLRYLIGKAKADFMVTGSGNEINSLIVLLRRKNSVVSRIYSLAVSPRYRGAGLGRLLLSKAEELAVCGGSTVLSLEVHEHNTTAISLYVNAGFYPVGEKLSYYKDGGKALLMRKKLR